MPSSLRGAGLRLVVADAARDERLARELGVRHRADHEWHEARSRAPLESAGAGGGPGLRRELEEARNRADHERERERHPLGVDAERAERPERPGERVEQIVDRRARGHGARGEDQREEVPDNLDAALPPLLPGLEREERDRDQGEASRYSSHTKLAPIVLPICRFYDFKILNSPVSQILKVVDRYAVHRLDHYFKTQR